MGVFHLLNSTENQIRVVTADFREIGIIPVKTCHCRVILSLICLEMIQKFLKISLEMIQKT
jgi:hypothetical protein